MANVHKFRSCFVPACENTTTKAPEKIYLSVPSLNPRRAAWFKAVGLPEPSLSTRMYYCCEDHFDLQYDAESLVPCEMWRGQLRLKPEVVPHLFDEPQSRVEAETDALALSSQGTDPLATIQIYAESSSKNQSLKGERKHQEGPGKQIRKKRKSSGVSSDQPSELVSTIARKNNRMCFVPNCTNMSQQHPEMNFITVPVDRKKEWFKAVGRNLPSTKTRFYCCEKHFNLEEDAVNYMKHRFKGTTLIMQNDVVPHLNVTNFNQQREEAKEEEFEIKDNRIEIEDHSALKIETDFTKPQQGSPTSINVGLSVKIESSDSFTNQKSKSQHVREWTLQLPAEGTLLPTAENNVRTQTGVPEKKDAATQTEVIGIRNVGTQITTELVKKHLKSQGVECNFGKKPTSSIGLSLVKHSNLMDQFPVLEPLPGMLILPDSPLSSPAKKPKLEDESSSSDEVTVHNIKKVEKESIVTATEGLIKNFTELYIGIPKAWKSLIGKLSCHSKIEVNHIYLTLMKIKLNDSFVRLGHLFAMTPAEVLVIFENTVAVLASYIKQFIIWPEADTVKLNLPIPFRQSYYAVQAIIDCLEVEIRKPTDSVKQALTWSNVRNCNTIKYLISATPDGLINFVSGGFGGRASDAIIVQESGFLSKLPAGCSVMARRGFKQVETLLENQGCRLVRLPSTSLPAYPSKEEIVDAKSVEVLRKHIEKIFERFVEFNFFKPDSVVNSKTFPYIDDAMTIAAGLINLQSPV